jgi:predicted dehydrogenase
MTKPLHVGLIGYGLNAVGHKTELEMHPTLSGRVKIIVAHDPDPEAKKNVEKLNEVKYANSFEDLLDTPELDAVIINSPPQFHADQVITAMESGLHVYSEVPMAIKENDIERIISAEESSRKVYQLGENYCFIPEVLYAGHLAESGKIGPTVYAESEYLHDVTYRWRKEGKGDENSPRVDSWYQLFDPLMYAHSIGPAQVALGGNNDPMPFVEVISYANDIGGYQGNPICKPAKAFQVGLFRTEIGAIAKCANAYIFAREPSRLLIQVVGRTGTYECFEIGKPGNLFLAESHKITRSKHRKGKSRIINEEELAKVIPPIQSMYFGGSVRIMDDWVKAIEEKRKATIHSKIAANFCMAGIAASKSARSGGAPQKIKVYSN